MTSRNPAAADPAVTAREAFGAAFGGAPTVVARAPGRLNLLGAHVDYNGGYVLPVAVDRDVTVAARGRADRRVRAVAADLDAEDAFGLAGLDDPGVGWASYIRGVAALLDRDGGISGADLVVAGNVPVGAGLSSSAAHEVAAAAALLALVGRSMEGPALARLCRRAEVEWAGVSCGIMDQFVAALARADHAVFLDARSLEYRHVPVPGHVRIIATDTGTRRDLQTSRFNERVEETRRAAELLGVPQLRDISPEAFAERSAILPAPIRARARHVVEEIERTRRGADLLADGRLEEFGALMYASHDSARRLYASSSPELDALVEAAATVDGVLGARLSGAGWGGATVSLVEADAVDAFVHTVPTLYHEATGRTATIHVCRVAGGVSLLEAPDGTPDPVAV